MYVCVLFGLCFWFVCFLVCVFSLCAFWDPLVCMAWMCWDGVGMCVQAVRCCGSVLATVSWGSTQPRILDPPSKNVTSPSRTPAGKLLLGSI